MINSSDYESLVTTVLARGENINLDEFYFLLLSHENIIEQNKGKVSSNVFHNLFANVAKKKRILVRILEVIRRTMVDSLELETILEALIMEVQATILEALIIEVQAHLVLILLMSFVRSVLYQDTQLISARTCSIQTLYLKRIMVEVLFIEVSGQIQHNLVEVLFMQIMVEEDISLALVEVVVFICQEDQIFMATPFTQTLQPFMLLGLLVKLLTILALMAIIA